MPSSVPTPDFTRLPGPAVELAAGRITLRGLPEETVQVELTLSHPYFVPGTIHVEPLSLALERGREAEVKVPVEEIGGAIEVDAGDAAGALLTDAAGISLRSAADRGFVRFTGLRAASYSVRLCPDAECIHPGRSWTSVAVSPAHTTRLR